jgi:hypothetical protein
MSYLINRDLVSSVGDDAIVMLSSIFKKLFPSGAKLT